MPAHLARPVIKIWRIEKGDGINLCPVANANHVVSIEAVEVERMPDQANGRFYFG